MYDNYGEFGGMHWIWWILWMLLLIWIFATPWDIPGQRTTRETPIDILKRRFANAEITKEEFDERKKILQQN
jgi:putative membrane protein